MSEITLVVAEDAPLDVQLWPTTTPEAGVNFTLRTVAVVRGPNGSWVEWTYLSGATRQFRLGERVACRLEDA